MCDRECGEPVRRLLPLLLLSGCSSYMGGLLCKQRSRSRPQPSAQSRRKKLHTVDCLLRGPCLLCFLVHAEPPAREPATSQDCARLLLLCPGELSAWQEKHLCGGLLRGTAEDMVCKRKNSGDNQTTITPRKQPRCAPDGGEEEDLEPQPHAEDLASYPRGEPSLCHGGETAHPHAEDLSSHPHRENLAPCSGGEPSTCHGGEIAHPLKENLSSHPHGEDQAPCLAGDIAPPQTGNPSSCLGGETVHPHGENLSSHPHGQDSSPCLGEDTAHPLTGDLSCLGGDTGHPRCEQLSSYTQTGDPSPCPLGKTGHPHCWDLSPCLGGETLYSPAGGTSPCPAEENVRPPTGELSQNPGVEVMHTLARYLSSCSRVEATDPKTRDLSQFPSVETVAPVPRDMSYGSRGQALSPPEGLTHIFAKMQEPSCSDSQKRYCQGRCLLTGDPALACTEQRAHSLPGNMSKQLPPRHLATSLVEDQEPHCSGVKTLRCHGEGHVTGDSVLYAGHLTRDPVTLCTKLQYKPVSEKPLELHTEDHRQPYENYCCCNSCNTIGDDHVPSSPISPSHVELSSSGCIQATPSQSPKVEGDIFVPCEPLHINQLPPSLLLKIFSLLSLNERCLSASLVCKYWRDLCLDFQFWKQLDLSSRQQVKDNLLEKIASRCWNITEINISDCLNVTDAGIFKLAMNCSGLVKYTAYRCKQLSDSSLVALATHCPSLKKVHVGNQDRLTDMALNQLGSRCKDLRDIHFGQCYKISDEGMVVIAKGCPKLQKIYMQENKLVTNRSVEAFAEHCPELQYVGFMGCSVTSHGVIHLTSLKNLSSLDLRNITELDNQTVVEIVKKCQNLTSLNLCLNRNIDDRCVEVIAKEGRRLKELYLVTCKITDHALIAIGRYSNTIETVDVGWCKEITDQGATLIAQSSKSIRYLGLMRCDQVNETTVEQLVQQYPHITFSTVLQDCKRTLERAYQMGWTPNASSVS